MAGVSTEFAIRDRMTAALNKINAASNRLDQALGNINRASNSIKPGRGFSEASPAISTAANNVDKFNRKQSQAATDARKVGNEWQGVQRMIKAAMAAITIKKVIELADAYTSTRARLDLINDGLQTTDQLQKKILESANKSRASYQMTADIVSKLGMQAGRAFSSNNEMIKFSELLNKTFAISGTEAAGIESTMYNLTQALSTGVLRGQDLNAVFSNAPMILQYVADYLGVGIDQIRAMAMEGQLTADVIKNAMLTAEEEINAKFGQMPMTFAQLGNLLGNMLMQAFQPVIQFIGQGAQWIYDNWSTIEPIFWGIVAAVGALTVIMGIWKLATVVMTAVQWALNHAMAASVIGVIVIAVGLLIGWLVSLSQKMGGLKVVWMVVCDALMVAWDWVKIAVMTGVNWIINLWEKMKFAFLTVAVGIQNFMGDMKVGVLMILQALVNGAIDIINFFIKALNLIPGVNINLIEHVTFGTQAQLENEAAKQARADDLANAKSDMDAAKAERDASLAQMKADAAANHAQRQADIAEAKAAAATQNTEEATSDKGSIGYIDEVGTVGKINDDVNISEEDLKFLRDVAEMRYVQYFVTLTPTVAMDNVQINDPVDLDDFVDALETKLENEFVMAAEGVYE